MAFRPYFDELITLTGAASETTQCPRHPGLPDHAETVETSASMCSRTPALTVPLAP
ncbi:hypothetical protein ACFZAV_39655 [Streptomyces sp. NPDC008343]|uniref:hypothetical protein n=1 Tax=Streptomyces sp. NPDC008343 TaxID=3364828 RepID=UPI0036E10F6B